MFDIKLFIEFLFFLLFFFENRISVGFYWIIFMYLYIFVGIYILMDVIVFILFFKFKVVILFDLIGFFINNRDDLYLIIFLYFFV